MNDLNPVAWLWKELEKTLHDEQYAELRADYQRQCDRYNRAARIRAAKRELSVYENTITFCDPSLRDSYRKKIASRKATIARLEAENERTT